MFGSSVAAEAMGESRVQQIDACPGRYRSLKAPSGCVVSGRSEKADPGRVPRRRSVRGSALGSQSLSQRDVHVLQLPKSGRPDSLQQSSDNACPQRSHDVVSLVIGEVQVPFWVVKNLQSIKIAY